jgi:hypothetical protein
MTNDNPGKIAAHLVEPNEAAGEEWWRRFVGANAGEINKRLRQAQVLYWSPSVQMPQDLFSYIREASMCFTIARYLACLVLSSSAVELILNKDTRMKDLRDIRRIGGWATLNNRNMEIGAEYGLPSEVLLSPGERLADATPIEFIKRRNQIAHGEILPLIRNLSDYDPLAELEALDQLTKSQRFVVGWFNSAPDVQTRKIQNHRWPDEK